MTALANIAPLKLDRTRQSAPQVFEALRELIVSVQLEPGTVLQRAELAEHFGISQTPIRDALLRLGEEQLIDIFPQHATVVSRIDLTAALQAHFLRRAIELEILATLCELPDAAHRELMQRLNMHLAVQEAALNPLDVPELALADQAFHQEMYEAARVGPLWALVRRQSGHVDRLRRLNLPVDGKPRAIVRDHHAIVEAIARKDAQAAQQALRRHLAGTLAFVEDIGQRFPQWIV
ncbi:transcriptional regulator, GntR family [Polaromonas sp. CG9_12]|uniref:GntR family transcriptional regulator n=1 Tax=Polaromonas sp. CG_9.11 TaxID=2787730 RepID=UPI0004DDCDC6|nr:GntR family transcriptional regulator [Polaromonas sp. CG_9.11]MBG6075045.1 DNA-binding GntR family transcriptional regulator [Polaromonas sp. CG_9.11]CDS55048.1 transcriptional regulator, GntR family [Polaromonas sp. CG9_12]